MADYCKQCSEELFGKDEKNFAGMIPPDLTDEVCPVICEGCGITTVNWEGRCVGGNCQNPNHKVDESIPFFGYA